MLESDFREFAKCQQSRFKFYFFCETRRSQVAAQFHKQTSSDRGSWTNKLANSKRRVKKFPLWCLEAKRESIAQSDGWVLRVTMTVWKETSVSRVEISSLLKEENKRKKWIRAAGRVWNLHNKLSSAFKELFGVLKHQPCAAIGRPFRFRTSAYDDFCCKAPEQLEAVRRWAIAVILRKERAVPAKARKHRRQRQTRWAAPNRFSRWEKSPTNFSLYKNKLSKRKKTFLRRGSLRNLPANIFSVLLRLWRWFCPRRSFFPRAFSRCD